MFNPIIIQSQTSAFSSRGVTEETLALITRAILLFGNIMHSCDIMSKSLNIMKKRVANGEYRSMAVLLICA